MYECRPGWTDAKLFVHARRSANAIESRVSKKKKKSKSSENPLSPPMQKKATINSRPLINSFGNF
jgi:hypothetical protein